MFGVESLFIEGAAENNRVLMIRMGEGAREVCSRHQGRGQSREDNHFEA